MNIQYFNETYGDKGGIPKLNELRSMAMSLEFIAEHFGTSKERVRQWMVELYGVKYDPRPIRRERIINSMIDFAKSNSEKDLYDAFKFHNEEYFVFALAECYQRGIYKK